MKIVTATDWHDGQFAHEGYAWFSLCLSGKSVIAEIVRWVSPKGVTHRVTCGKKDGGLRFANPPYAAFPTPLAEVATAARYTAPGPAPRALDPWLSTSPC